MMVTCNICKREFKKVTNSHLRDKHQIDKEEYLRLFPGSRMTSEELLENLSKISKGKTYEERYGKEKTQKLLRKRSADAKKQFEDVNQRIIRRNVAWKGYKDISGDFWRCLKAAGKKKGQGFDLTIEYIWELFEQQKGICKLSGLPIYLETSLGSFNKNGYQRRTASLDRVDSSKGYLQGNVQWLHKDINQMKSDRTDEQFVEFCKAVALYSR
jgi:hypothetical protein